MSEKPPSPDAGQSGYSEPAPGGGYSEPVPHLTPYGTYGVVSNLPFGVDTSNDSDPFIVTHAFSRRIDGFPESMSFNFGAPFADAIDRVADKLDASRDPVLRALYNAAHPAHRALREFMSDERRDDGQVIGGPGLAAILRPCARLRRMGEAGKLILANISSGLTIQVGGIQTAGGQGGLVVESLTGYSVRDVIAPIVAAEIVTTIEQSLNPTEVSAAPSAGGSHAEEAQVQQLQTQGQPEARPEVQPEARSEVRQVQPEVSKKPPRAAAPRGGRKTGTDRADPTDVARNAPGGRRPGRRRGR